ncbi:hypothetical protein [Hymenobacter algoricola]|uniref:Uncharacterized protein n=1 Tax=Hymenobacter algoricola TaxID=486267 RepID=A0ABP7NU11_9BACT
MIPPEILAWLAQPTSFAAGAALYAQHGGSGVYQRLFAAGETSYSRQVLVQQLRGCCDVVCPDEVPKATRVTVPDSAPTVVAAPAEATTTHTVAPDLLPIRAQLRVLRDERSQLHAQLTAPRLSQKDRGRMALRILDIGELVLEQLLLEAHVLHHGALPAGPVALADLVDEGELRRRLSNLVALRAKLRKNEKRAAELPGVEADILLIRSKLTPTISV